MMDTNLEQKLTSLIEPILDRHNVFLVELGTRGERNTKIIEIFIDTEEGINIDKLSILSREINEVIKREQLVIGNFRLDVSSPGLDRPLKIKKQYSKNIGRMLEISYLEDGELKKITGVLEFADDQKILLKGKDVNREFSFDDIQKAHVKLPW